MLLELKYQKQAMQDQSSTSKNFEVTSAELQLTNEIAQPNGNEIAWMRTSYLSKQKSRAKSDKSILGLGVRK